MTLSNGGIGIPARQYYYRKDGCRAQTSKDADCICWHDRGTGPYPNAAPGDQAGRVTLSWRDKPVAARDDDVPNFTPGSGNKARRRMKALGIEQQAEPSPASFTDLVVAPSPATGTAPAQNVEVLGETCIDGGACHHKCTTRCFRRECCTHFSDYTGPWAYDKPAPTQTEREAKPRPEFLELAEAHGARITGKPDGSEPIEIVFSIQAWRAFDQATRPAQTAPAQDEREAVGERTQKERERWIDTMRDAIKSGLPKVTRQRMEQSIAGIERSIQYGGTQRLRDRITELEVQLATVPAQTEQQPVKLQHMAYAEDGVLHWMSGRKIANCELYAMPDFGNAPKLYAAPIAQTAPQPDLSGLVEALEQYADDSNWCFDTCKIDRDIAKDALAAYHAALSAQGGE